jgi:hypothetical protein
MEAAEVRRVLIATMGPTRRTGPSPRVHSWRRTSHSSCPGAQTVYLRSSAELIATERTEPLGWR